MNKKIDENIEEINKGEKYLLKFNNIIELATKRDGFDYNIQYDIIDYFYIDKPEEKSKCKNCKIKVGISYVLSDSWIAHSIKPENLKKIIFEYGKRYINYRCF
jgi:hypothetical protein